MRAMWEGGGPRGLYCSSPLGFFLYIQESTETHLRFRGSKPFDKLLGQHVSNVRKWGWDKYLYYR